VGNLLDDIRRDARNIVTSGGFETSITFSKGTETFDIKGVAIKRTDNLQLDDGSSVNEKFSRIIVVIAELPASFKNGDLIIVLGWTVSFLDSEGFSSTYKLADSYPNKTLGLLSVNLAKNE
jgi:hypothetical protein